MQKSTFKGILRFTVYAWHPKPWVMEDTPPVSWMLDRILPKDVVYDIVANRGYFALALLSNVPGVRLFAFEPNPEVMSKLRANLELNKDKGYARPFEKDLGAEEGSLRSILHVLIAPAQLALFMLRIGA